MPYMGAIGELVERREMGTEEFSVDWRIPEFSSLSDEHDSWYHSPEIRFGDERWILFVFPNWRDETQNASGWVRLTLLRFDRGPKHTFRVSVGIRGSRGVEKIRGEEREFDDHDYICHWDDFCSRSELLEHRTRLMPEGCLTIHFVLKRTGSDRGVSSFPHPSSIQVASTNKSQSSDKRGVSSFPHPSSTPVASTNKSQSSDKRDASTQTTDILETEVKASSEKKEIESVTEQTKSLQKTVENYELELVNFKKQISSLEREKLSIADEYKSLLEEKLTITSGLEKDKDLLKQVVESFMEQTKRLQKTVENYELESENLKKQISTLEKEKLSIADEYKRLLEEKLTINSGLEKDSSIQTDDECKDFKFLAEESQSSEKQAEFDDDDAEENKNGNNDDENHESKC